MATNDTIESYLVRLGLRYEEVEEGTWLIHDDDGQIVVRHDEPVLVCRMKLMDAPTEGREALFERLLELNASEMMSAAYGLEGGAIVAVASLQSENLDFNELQGAIDSLALAGGAHQRTLEALGK